MPITVLDEQRQHAQVGRIRIGTSVAKPGSEYRKPVKLDQFRITTPTEHLARQVADLYGGTPELWTPQGGGSEQWEVLTDAKVLDVVVPPKAMTQWFELWQGGSCRRRCDGVRDVLRDVACPCGPDPERRQCKPTTRVNLMLARIPTIGVWRLETHGFYAAVQIPPVVELLQSMGGYQPAVLTLIEQVKRLEGKPPQRWIVPQLDITHAPAAAIMGTGDHLGIAASNAGRPAIGATAHVDDSEAEEPATAAGGDALDGELVTEPTPAVKPEPAGLGKTWQQLDGPTKRAIISEIGEIPSRVELTKWRTGRMNEHGRDVPKPVTDALNARWNALPSGRDAAPATSAATPVSEPAPDRVEREPVTEPAPVREPEPVAEPAPAAPADKPRTEGKSREAAFMAVAQAAALAGWNNARIQDAFTSRYGHGVTEGTPAEFDDFVQHVK